MYEKLLSVYDKYKEVILYLFFGGLTTAVNYITYIVCAWLLPVSTTTIPTTIAWLVAVLFAYATNRTWVFNSQAHTVNELVREFITFLGARVISGLMDIAIMWIAVDTMGYNDLIIKLLSNVLVVIINYILSKFLIFKKTS